MLDSTLKTQLQSTLERLVQPIELIASLDEQPASAEMRELLQEVAELSPKIALRFDGTAKRQPSFQIAPAHVTLHRAG